MASTSYVTLNAFVTCNAYFTPTSESCITGIAGVTLISSATLGSSEEANKAPWSAAGNYKRPHNDKSYAAACRNFKLTRRVSY